MSFDLAQLNGWGYVHLVIVAISFVYVLYALTQPRKYQAPVTGGRAAGIVLLTPIFVGIFYVPWFLAVKYPLNWAALVYLAWLAVVMVIAFVRLFTGKEGRAGYRGGALFGWSLQRTAVSAIGLFLFFVATGVLTW